MTDSAAAPMEQLAEYLGRQAQLDRPARKLRRLARSTVGSGSMRRVLSGESLLGHPLHPALTDLPIGFWTSAMVLDVVGGRRHARSSQTLVGLGVLSVGPTALAGWSDFTGISDERRRRIATVHAGTNAAATILYASSWWARRRGAWAAGAALSFVGAGVATIGGALGGHLVFGTTPSTASVAEGTDIVDLTTNAPRVLPDAPH